MATISALSVMLHSMVAVAQLLLGAQDRLRPDKMSELRTGAASGFATTSTCVLRKPPEHIVIVIEENHGYSKIIGNPEAAYINSLAAIGMLFTNYHAIGHPSQPNYFALFSGSTQGVKGDGPYFFPNTPTLAGELKHAGYSFVGYAEFPADRDHAPWLSFGDSQRDGQPFSRFPTDYNALPTISFVSPNVLNDMHDGTIAQGDRWLNANLSAYANWAPDHNSWLVVTFDEDQGTRNNRVATFVVGAGIVAGRSTQRVDHYALIHTLQVLYGLPPLGASAAAPVMNLALAELCLGRSLYQVL